MKLDATGAILATLGCTAAVFGFSMGPEKGWLDADHPRFAIAAAGVFFIAFVIVERSAQNPVVPFDLFKDRNRVATFVAIFLAGGVMFTLTVTIGLYVQDILGYSAFVPGSASSRSCSRWASASAVSSQLVSVFSPRVLTIAGGVLVLGAMLYGSTLQRGIPYFPNLVRRSRSAASGSA